MATAAAYWIVARMAAIALAVVVLPIGSTAEVVEVPDPNSAPARAGSAPAPDPHEGPLYDERFYFAIEKHIREKLGEYHLVWHEMVSEHAHIDVIPVPPSADHPYWTLVTAGMSYKPMTLGAKQDSLTPDWGRAELVIVLPKDWFGERGPTPKALSDEALYYPIRLLKSLARFPHEHGTWLGPGHTIDRGAPLGPSTEQSAALIHWPDALPESFHRLPIGSGHHVNFYAIYPLYAEERALAAKDGTNALLDAFEAAKIDFLAFDPKRRRAVETVSRTADAPKN